MEQFSLQLFSEKQIYSVRELNAEIRDTLETEFRDIRVAGEISGCRLATSGHCYFTLKEQDSTVKCVCYRSAFRYLKFKPQDGIAVVVRGQVGVFEARGEYQIQVETLEPQGLGRLQLAFDELKKKLGAEGLFESSRKRPLPAFPRRIGIVTSPQGAVISDILNVLERRFPGLQIRLFPAQVQGEGSTEDVCRGIDYFSRSGWAEVVIVARGGGSLEDLWTFNTEQVARAIVGSKVPVISAVGHETDVTIADFCADLRAPTPSAAAEILCATRLDLLTRIRGWENQMTQRARYRVAIARQELQTRGAERIANVLLRAIGRQLQKIDDDEYRLKENVRKRIAETEIRRRHFHDRLRHFDQRPMLERARGRLEFAQGAVVRLMKLGLKKQSQNVEKCLSSLGQLSPIRVLERGYAVVTNQAGEALKSPRGINVGATVRIRLAEGKLDAEVTGHHSE